MAVINTVPAYGYGISGAELVPAYGYGLGVKPPPVFDTKEITLFSPIRRDVELTTSVAEKDVVEMSSRINDFIELSSPVSPEKEVVEFASVIRPVIFLVSQIVNAHSVNASGSALLGFANPANKARISVNDVGISLRVATDLNFDDNPLASHAIQVRDCFGVEKDLLSTIFDNPCGVLEHIVVADDFIVPGQYIIQAKVVTLAGEIFFGEATELEVFDEFQLQFP